jgi:phenol 2-monooxygenase
MRKAFKVKALIIQPALRKDGTSVEQLMDPTSFEMADDVNSTEFPITVKVRHLAPSVSSKEDSKSGLYRSNLFATDVTSTVPESDKEADEVIRARYMVGCDGARSWVRK